MSSHVETFGGCTITIADIDSEILAALENAKKRALRTIGDKAAGYAQDVITAEKRVDTGRLRNSIAWAVSGGKAVPQSYTDDKGNSFSYHGKMAEEEEKSVYVGSNVEYAIFNEEGSVRMTGIHFLRQAATQHADEYKGIVKQSLENA